jgi:hypothetical protein
MDGDDPSGLSYRAGFASETSSGKLQGCTT